jgi:hypothetical protein
MASDPVFGRPVLVTLGQGLSSGVTSSTKMDQTTEERCCGRYCPDSSWTLGRVLEVYPDKKGTVRVVKVKTPTTVLQRPIHKLCMILEADLVHE